eukprot:4984341-Prymnesium_polylepis.1
MVATWSLHAALPGLLAPVARPKMCVSVDIPAAPQTAGPTAACALACSTVACARRRTGLGSRAIAQRSG